MADHDDTWRRKIGFECPWHPQQIISWVVFFGQSLLVYLFVLPQYTLPVAVPLGLISFAAQSAVVILAAIIMSTNPLDPLLADDLDQYIARYKITTDKETLLANCVWCRHCKQDVLEGTKHCRMCNKCIGGFDHHCSWLNTCIGMR
uniref:Palmitoyltransferase n=1 Tax=Lotharella globosa TaxID=91324 RepID=A0A7S4E193_9EUKA